MKYFEFGQEQPEIMVLFHGGGVCYKGAIPTAKVLAKKYHVILNAYDGFNPSEPETEYKSAMDEARRMGDYIVENYGGKIDILYGVSYGCRVVNEVLQDERLTITTTIMDGMSTKDYPDIKSEWGKNLYCFFLTGLFFVVMGRAGEKRMKFIAKITGRRLEDAKRMIYTKATWKSWKNQDYYLIGRKTNFEAFKKTDVHIWHGIKSSVEKKLARNMNEWQDAGYAFTYKIFTDLGHGGLVGEHPEQFLEEVTKAHENSLEKEQ